jgi:hypothetical protein
VGVEGRGWPQAKTRHRGYGVPATALFRSRWRVALGGLLGELRGPTSSQCRMLTLLLWRPSVRNPGRAPGGASASACSLFAPAWRPPPPRRNRRGFSSRRCWSSKWRREQRTSPGESPRSPAARWRCRQEWSTAGCFRSIAAPSTWADCDWRPRPVKTARPDRVWPNANRRGAQEGDRPRGTDMKRVAAARTTGCYRNPYQAPLTASRWKRGTTGTKRARLRW